MGQLRNSICTALLAFPILASAGADICQGLIQDKVIRPPQTIPKPAKRATYTDPSFGTTIRRVTEVPVGSENAVIKPMYATMQAWNADESFMILWQRGRGHLLFDGKNYNFIRQLNIAPTDIEQVLWDLVDPDIFYYPTNYDAVPNLMAHRLSTDTSFLIKNFQGAPTNCPVDWGKLLSLGSDPQYMSYGAQKIVGLKCGDRKFTYSISQNQILAIGDSPSVNAPIPSPSGNLIYFDGYVLDAAGRFLRTLDMLEPDSHASIGRSALGNDSYNAVAFDDAINGTLVSHNMNTGAKKVIIGPATGYPYPPSGTHISAIATQNAGWVAVSAVGNPAAPGLLDQELVLANTDTGQVCRIGHHRSWAGEGQWGYWSEPHNVISPSGTRVLFASDWGNSASVDTYVVELPSFVNDRLPTKVTGFFLYDRVSGKDIVEIKDGDEINLAAYVGRGIDIRVKVVPANVTMMYLHVNNKSYGLDTTIPYSFFGTGNYSYPGRTNFVLGSNSVAAVALNDEGKVDGKVPGCDFYFRVPISSCALKFGETASSLGSQALWGQAFMALS